MEIGFPPRPSPLTPFSINSTPSLIPTPAGSGANTPTAPFHPDGRIVAPRKRSVNKSDISEPTFLSSTYKDTTVNLPPGASLQNGASKPPIPPVNPRRRQPRAIIGALMGKKDEIDETPSLPSASQSTEEISTFSDEGDSKPKTRQKLRKSSSEGGNLNARARQAAIAAPSPGLPGNFPPGSASPGDNNMF